jgi:hypothetical protein
MLTVAAYLRHLLYTTRYLRYRVGVGLLERQWNAVLLRALA